MPKDIDVTKPVRMKEGTPVEIVCSDLAPPYSLLIVYYDGVGNKTSIRRTKDGLSNCHSSSEFDLENIPETYDLWVNCYPNASSAIGHRTIEVSKKNVTKDCHARIKVKVTVGRFDD